MPEGVSRSHSLSVWFASETVRPRQAWIGDWAFRALNLFLFLAFCREFVKAQELRTPLRRAFSLQPLYSDNVVVDRLVRNDRISAGLLLIVAARLHSCDPGCCGGFGCSFLRSRSIAPDDPRHFKFDVRSPFRVDERSTIRIAPPTARYPRLRRRLLSMDTNCCRGPPRRSSPSTSSSNVTSGQ